METSDFLALKAKENIFQIPGKIYFHTLILYSAKLPIELEDKTHFIKICQHSKYIYLPYTHSPEATREHDSQKKKGRKQKMRKMKLEFQLRKETLCPLL